jgi:hypothetical protein
MDINSRFWLCNSLSLLVENKTRITDRQHIREEGPVMDIKSRSPSPPDVIHVQSTTAEFVTVNC